MSAATSPIRIDGALVFPEGIEGITDASATRTFENPFNLRSAEFTTVLGWDGGPMAQVPT